MRVQSSFLLGRLSDTYIDLAIGMGNRDKIDSEEGEVLSHMLSPQSHSPNDVKRCRHLIHQIASFCPREEKSNKQER